MRRLSFSLSLAGLVAAGLAAPAWAEDGTASVGAAPAADTGTGGDGAGGLPAKRAWIVKPSITLQETLTDHVNAGQDGSDGDLITRISPGVSVRSDTARVKFNLDYHLDALVYANNSDSNEIRHSLNTYTLGSFEAVENWLYVDLDGKIGQQYVSALGPQSPDQYGINDNLTQTYYFRISPYIKGKLGGFSDYQLRYDRAYTTSDSGQVSDTDTEMLSGMLSGDTPYAKLGWSIDGNLKRYSYSDGRDTESDSLRGMLIYNFDPQLNFRASVGRESNDFISLEKETYNTHGYGFDWRPTPRTDISAFREKRFFGYGHNISLKHRMKRIAVQFTDSRDTSALPNRLTAVGLGTIYDLLNSMLSSKFPDAAERAQATETLLAVWGIPPNTQVVGGFLTSQVTLQRRQELSVLLSGLRNTVTLSVNRTSNEGLSTLAGLGDDFDTYRNITQQGLAINWSHRLSPQSTLGISGTYTESTGRGTAGEDDASTTQLTATYTAKLGARTNGSLSVRRSDFSGSTSSDYTEHAVVGTLSMTF